MQSDFLSNLMLLEYLLMSGVDGFKIFKKQLLRIKRIMEENYLVVKIVLLYRTYDFWETVNSDFYKLCRGMFTINDIKTEFFSWFGSVKADDPPEGAKLIIEDNTNKKMIVQFHMQHWQYRQMVT